MNNPIVPGDIISALHQSFTVWTVLYQDYYEDVFDVEFIDDMGRYHHWKQAYDGGTVTRSGSVGIYYADVNSRDNIARIRPARTPGTYIAEVLTRSGCTYGLGRYSSIESARSRLDRHGATHGQQWQKMP